MASRIFAVDPDGVRPLKRIVLLVLLVLPALVPARAAAQAPVTSVMLRPLAFSSPDSGGTFPITVQPITPSAPPRPRLRNAVIGGVIGAAAGVVVCTAISNIADDAAVSRFTTCTAKGYLLTGGIGFALGFGVGWLI